MSALRIEWTPELLDLLPPFRNDGPVLTTAPVDGTALFELARATGYRGISEGARKVLASGAVGSIADEATSGPLAYFAEPRGKPRPTDETRERIATELVDRWVAAFGTAGVIDLLAGVVAPAHIHHWLLAGFLEAVASRLRRHLAHARDYDAALRNAMKLLKGFPVGTDTRRSPPFSTLPLPEVMSFLFPDHRPFFELALEHNTKADWTHTLLVGAVTTKAELDRVWPKANGNRWALAIARRLGADGLEPLAGYAYASVGLVHALSVYVDARAAKAMVRHLEAPDCRAPIASYFHRYPELSPALHTLAKDAKPAARNAAQRILDALTRTKPTKTPPHDANGSSTAAQRPRATRDRAVFLGTVAGKGSSVNVVAMDAARAPAWDGRAKDGSSVALLEELTRSGQGLFFAPQTSSVPILETEAGLAIVELFPHDGDVEGLGERLAERLPRLTARRKPKLIGTVHVRSGALALVDEHGSATDLTTTAIRRAASAGAVSTIDDTVLVPLANGVYEVFEESIDVEDDLGLVETRFRFQRAGDVPAGAPPKLRAAKAASLDPSGLAATSLGIATVSGRVLAILDSATARVWDADKDSARAHRAPLAGASLRVGGAEAILVDAGAVEATHVWKASDGLRLLEFYPKAGLDPDSKEVMLSLGRYVEQLPPPKGARRLGSVLVTKGCLVVMETCAKIPPAELAKVPAKRARAVRAKSGFQLAALVPLEPGPYEVYAERLGGTRALSTEIGRIDRRIRIVRTRVEAKASKPKAKAMKKTKGVKAKPKAP